MDSYVINENGEKVLAASRRPDGTLRKERRIRAGYTPQDEQPVYQSQGVMVREPGAGPALCGLQVVPAAAACSCCQAWFIALSRAPHAVCRPLLLVMLLLCTRGRTRAAAREPADLHAAAVVSCGVMRCARAVAPKHPAVPWPGPR
jgi:hypothetical protein